MLIHTSDKGIKIMKIFLDTANVEEISEIYSTGLIDGITTNPSLILKSGRTLEEVAETFSNNFSNLESISCEVVADTAEEMIEQAEKFIMYGRNITIKVPCTKEGLKACKYLSDRDVPVNVTLVFSVAQAILANKAGASYISPFVGRWEDNSVDGLGLIKNLRTLQDKTVTFYNDNVAQILAASIRDVRQVEQCALSGADIVTIPPKVFWSMYKNIMTDIGLDIFMKDWEDVINKK